MLKFLSVVFGIFISSTVVNAQPFSKYALSNYLIPLNEIGGVVGYVVPAPTTISLLSDTSSLFCIDSNTKSIKLKADKLLAIDQVPFRYNVDLLIDGTKYSFELLKDGFSKNRVVAHRGAWKQTNVLQNSIRSFENAVNIKCQASELDVWLTADNKVVLSHDPQVYGLEVENMTMSQLYEQSKDKADPIPSLEELLIVAQNQNVTHPIIEIKNSQKGLERTLQLTDSVVSLVHRLKMQGYVEYISFNYDVLKRIRQLDATAKTLYLMGGQRALEELVSDRISGIDYSYQIYNQDAELLSNAESFGLLTNVWTVNNVDELKKYYKSGVDYITTDMPELLLEIIQDDK